MHSLHLLTKHSINPIRPPVMICVHNSEVKLLLQHTGLRGETEGETLLENLGRHRWFFLENPMKLVL